MQRLLIFTLLICLSFSGLAQKKKGGKADPVWFFFSLGGGYGNSMFMSNTTVDGIKNSSVNPAYSFSGKLGVMLPWGFGVAFELGSSTLTQKYTITNLAGTSDQAVKISTFDKTLLLRGGPMNRGYAELGFNFCSVTSPEYTFRNLYKTNITELVLGFGVPVVRHNVFDVSIGLRAYYSLSDLMEEGNYPWASSTVPIPAGTTYSATHPFVAQLRIDASWHIGYFAMAKCNKRVEFLFFQP